MVKYSKAELSFLEVGFKAMRVPELTQAFNLKFGTKKTQDQIKGTLTRNGFKCGRSPGFKKGENTFLLTREQVCFLKAEYQVHPVSVVTKLLNAKFGLVLTRQQVKTFISNHKITCGRTGRFKKGQLPWNTGTKGTGVCKPNSGCFKKGTKPLNKKPFGHERVCSKDGYLLVKMREKNPYTGALGWYRPKHIVVWEQFNGPVPKGSIVRFKDGNKLNPSIENLEMVSKAVNLRLNQSGYSLLPDEVKPTALALAELEVKTFNRAKENSNVK